MYILPARYILTCNDDFEIIEDKAIAFDEHIVAIDEVAHLIEQYPNAKLLKRNASEVVMPGLINAHTHLEFSAHRGQLHYGDFMQWLYSVIQNREEVIGDCSKELIDEVLLDMLKTGTTTIGAISSYGLDLESCVQSAMRVVYFNEAIGSKADMVDALFDDVMGRWRQSMTHKSSKFMPSIAIHSPYSVHPVLIKKLIQICQDEQLLCSTHFLESLDEVAWLDRGEGGFKKFFGDFFGDQSYLQKPLHTKEEFLDYFGQLSRVLLAHGTYMPKETFAHLCRHRHDPFAVVHCPMSNRLLTNGKLSFDYLRELQGAMGTDGLSSNYSLSLFDELRNALSTHNDVPLQTLTKELILSATHRGAKALDLNTGQISIGKKADIIALSLSPNTPKERVAQELILHTKAVNMTIIDGEICYEND